MKILFLGTGAADWIIDQHKEFEGFRRNAAALIDDCFLIDPGPDVLDALCTFGKSAEDIKYIINTHKHSDHYSEETVSQLKNAVFCPLVAGEVKNIGEIHRYCFGGQSCHLSEYRSFHYFRRGEKPILRTRRCMAYV